MKKYKIVLVSWNDANFEFDPDRPNEVNSTVGYTLGYLIKENKEVVVIASEVFTSGDVRQVTAIPRGMVKKITFLRSFSI